MYQVELEIISTVMNFLCIVQGELSFMFAQGITSNASSVKLKGRKVFFPINVIIHQTPDKKYVIWPFLYFFLKTCDTGRYVFAVFLFVFNIAVIVTKPLLTGLFFTGSSSA